MEGRKTSERREGGREGIEGRMTTGERKNGRRDSFEGDKSKPRSEQRRNISIRPETPRGSVSLEAVISCGTFYSSCRMHIKFGRHPSDDDGDFGSFCSAVHLGAGGRGAHSVLTASRSLTRSNKSPFICPFPEKLSQEILGLKVDCGGGEREPCRVSTSQ